MIIAGNAVAAFVAERTGFVFRTPHVALGFSTRDGVIRAGIIFQNWSGNDIELTVAGDEIPRSLLKAAFEYVTHGLKANRATFRTRSDNRAARAAMRRLGARQEGRQRLFYGDCDALLYGILKDEFPYGHK